jgi:hypothetical protein
MKKFALAALVALSSTFAHAAPVSCTTNVDHNLRLGSTNVVIEQKDGKTVITQSSNGGMAHWVSRAKTFAVTVTHEGPEVVRYTNDSEGFDLTVVYQPIGGEIRGTLVTEAMGEKLNTPVVCSAAE